MNLIHQWKITDHYLRTELFYRMHLRLRSNTLSLVRMSNSSHTRLYNYRYVSQYLDSGGRWHIYESNTYQYWFHATLRPVENRAPQRRGYLHVHRVQFTAGLTCSMAWKSHIRKLVSGQLGPFPTRTITNSDQVKLDILFFFLNNYNKDRSSAQ